MAFNVINQWFINYKPSIILEAITLAVMYLVLTSDHLCIVASLSGRLLGIPYLKIIESVSHENKTMGI